MNESIGDMKSGRAIRKVLESVDTVDGLALVACSARWRETDIDLTLRITNVGPIAWSRLQTSICLQRPAAPDYLDEEDTRTYLVSDEGFVASAELVFPSRRRLVYAWVGEELPMKKGARRRLAAPALFVVSRDERYVLGYAWQQARRLFLNRAGCVPFRASAPAPATGYRIRERGDARRCVPALLRVERHERPADIGEEAQHIDSFLLLTRDLALKQAQAEEDAVMRGESIGQGAERPARVRQLPEDRLPVGRGGDRWTGP